MNSRSAIFALLAAFACAFTLSLLPARARAQAPALSAEQRDELRYHLENQFNEVDLMIKNRRADEGDTQRQQKEFKVLHVFERVPLKEDLEGLRKEVSESAHENGLVFTDLKVTRRSKAKPVPSQIYTDREKPFQLSHDQLVEDLEFEAHLQGPLTLARSWVATWPDQVVRLIEPIGEPVSDKAGHLTVRARAFVFRDIHWPKLVVRDPIELLPGWARTSGPSTPGSFARQEPTLWNFVTQIRTLAPQARPLYDLKGQFMLNGERMDFLLSKAPKGHSH